MVLELKARELFSRYQIFDAIYSLIMIFWARFWQYINIRFAIADF